MARLYLKDNVREMEGLKSIPHKENCNYEYVSFRGMAKTLHVKGEAIYLDWNLDTPIPDAMKDVVDSISSYEDIPRMARRESGIYRYQSAECELKPAHFDRSDVREYFLHIIAKTAEDARELRRLILTGVLRPEESFEGPQNGKMKAEFRQELETIRADLDSGFLPFCNKRKIAAKLQELLSCL